MTEVKLTQVKIQQQNITEIKMTKYSHVNPNTCNSFYNIFCSSEKYEEYKWSGLICLCYTSKTEVYQNHELVLRTEK